MSDWCETCHKALPKMEAAWGAKQCRACMPEERSTDVPRVPLEDIDDIWGYVIRYIERRFAQMPPHEREEYVAEGLAIAYRLHRDSWRREQTPSFRLYLSTYLWNRLRDYRRQQLRQAGEARRGESGSLWAGKDSIEALAERGHVLAAPDEGELAA